MPVCDEVRRTQRTLAALDAAHTSATTRVDQARARRAEVLAQADAAVTSAAGVEAAVAEDGRGRRRRGDRPDTRRRDRRGSRIAKAAQASPGGNGARNSSKASV